MHFGRPLRGLLQVGQLSLRILYDGFGLRELVLQLIVLTDVLLFTQSISFEFGVLLVEFNFEQVGVFVGLFQLVSEFLEVLD